MRAHSALVLSLTLVAGRPVAAQLRLPQASPGATVSQEIGISKVTVEYHRPGVKGRPIWGALVPYEKTWRLGANDATTLTLTHAAKVAGKDLAAGTYALFAVPGKERWTIVVNIEAKQWGAYFYKPEEDVLRFEVTPETGPPTEWMTIALVPASPASIRFEWSWEKLRFSFPIEVDVERIVWKEIDDALAAKPDDVAVLLQAARYARDKGQRLAEATAWLDRSLKIKESFWNLELKARFLDDDGKTADALPLLAKAMTLAEGKAPKEYVDGLRKTEAEWQAKLRK